MTKMVTQQDINQLVIVDGLVKKLAKNTKALIIGLAGVFEEVGKSGVGQDGGWFSSSNFEKGVEIAMQLGEPYTTLVICS